MPTTKFVNDALPLEYKLKERCAIGNFDVSDAVNNPIGLGIVGISGYGLQEEFLNFIGVKFRAFNNDLPNPVLVGSNRPEMLP